MSEAFRLGIRPPSLLSPPDWASENVKLQGSERSAKFDISQTPWQRAPMECGGDSHTRQIVMLAPTGSGKSTMAEGFIPWVVSEDPGAFLYASQTDSASKFWVETRLEPALRSCRNIDKLWPSDRHKTRTRDIIFPHMPFTSGGANATNFNEKSMRYLYGDEAWKWNKGLMGLFLKRHHDRWNRKVFIVSQAGWHEDDLDAEWKKTDMAKWSFKCPKCKEFTAYDRSVLAYDVIKDESGSEIDTQATADTARVTCGSCGEQFKDTPKSRRDLTNTGKYISTSDNALTGHRGFRMHRLAIWWIPWSNYVLKLLEAKRKLDLGDVTSYMQMCQADDCTAWKDDMGVEKNDMKVSYSPMKERDPKEKIEDETVRFFSMDKGGDHFWGSIRAWSAGKASELLWEGFIPATDDEVRIKDLQAKFGVKDQHVFMDIGFEWSKTVELCGKNGWWGIRGNGQVRSYQHKIKGGGVEERLYSTIKYATGEDGTRARYIEIATDPIKDVLWRLMNGSGLDWSIPPDVSKTYRKHMAAEVRKEGPKGKSKQIVGYWEQTSRQNHLFDCEVYNTAGALIFGIFGD